MVLGTDWYVTLPEPWPVLWSVTGVVRLMKTTVNLSCQLYFNIRFISITIVAVIVITTVTAIIGSYQYQCHEIHYQHYITGGRAAFRCWGWYHLIIKIIVSLDDSFGFIVCHVTQPWLTINVLWNSIYFTVCHMRGLVCQKQVSMETISNYIPPIPWHVITRPCPWYLPLTHKVTYIPILIIP